MTSPLPLPELSAKAPQPFPHRARYQDIVLAGTVALLMFGPLAFGAVEPWSLFVLEAGSVLCLGIWLTGILRTGQVGFSRNPVFAPLLAFLALICLQLLPGISAYRYATYASLLRYSAYGIVIFLLTQTLTRTRHVQRAAVALGVFGSAVSFFAILQNLSSPGKLYWFRVPRFGGWIYGPYVNHNHYAGLMEMLVPIPMVFAFSRYAHGRNKWTAAGAAALMGSTVFLSGSRGGMAAFALQVAVFFWFVFRERTHGRIASIMAAFLIASPVLVAWIGGSEVSKRLATLTPQEHSELASDIRGKINRDALRMFLARPVMGWGLGTFTDVYPQFRSIYTDALVDHAHDDYAELLAETGAIGFAIAVWFLWSACRHALRKLKNWPSDINGAISLAALLGILGILAHSFVDFNLQIPANAMLFYALCGVAAMDPRFRNPRREARKCHVAEEALAPQP